MQFDAVESGSLGVCGAAAIVIDNAGDLVRFQCPRRDKRLRALRGHDCSRWLQCRRRHRCRAVWLQRWVRDAAHVPQLEKDAAAGIVDRLGHALPARDLFLRKDAGRARIALALLGNLRAFGHDEARVGALHIIRHRDRVWHLAGAGAVARHRRHHQAVRQLRRTELVRGEYVDVLGGLFGVLGHGAVRNAMRSEK